MHDINLLHLSLISIVPKSVSASLSLFLHLKLFSIVPKSVSAANKNSGCVPYSWVQLLNWVQLFIPEDAASIQLILHQIISSMVGEAKKQNMVKLFLIFIR